MILNLLKYKRKRIPKGNQKTDNPEKLETQNTQDEEKSNKPQHNTCWTPLYENIHKQRKLD